jgi:hypothetical protein
MRHPFFYELAIEPEPRRVRAIAISTEEQRTKRAILTVATLSAVWFLVYMAPDVRRYMRIRSM